jgi:hypothetical protein
MPEPHLRAADTDREAVGADLGRHMAAGRLTLAEYDERLAQVYAARTYGELDELTADLPALTSARPAAPATTPVPRPMTAGCASRGMPVTPPVALWAAHGVGHGTPEHSWRSWLATSVTVLVVYLAISLASWEFSYFWPMWVIGPWGAVLLAQRLTGAARAPDDAPQPGR